MSGFLSTVTIRDMCGGGGGEGVVMNPNGSGGTVI